MQNAYVMERIAQIRVQDRLDEARADRLAAVAARRPTVVDRLADSLRAAFESDEATDLTFVPKLDHYPVG